MTEKMVKYIPKALVIAALVGFAHAPDAFAQGKIFKAETIKTEIWNYVKIENSVYLLASCYFYSKSFNV